MNKIFFLAYVVGLFFNFSAFAQIRDFQTTRLNSTAGTGVASILSTEAAILNPASAAFFDDSSASYQSYSTSLRKENSLRKSLPDRFAKHNTSSGLFVADHSGPVKGGIAYLKQSENRFKRDKLVLHGSAPMGPNAAMGFSYNYIQDQVPSRYQDRHRYYHQLTLGTTYIIDDKTILGIVVNDPTRTNSGDERIVGGFQYGIGDRMTVLGDAGMQYTKSISKKYLWRAALQVNIFADFFLRAGKFYDNVTEFKGTGWGVGWIGPRLGIEFAQKFSDQIGEGQYIYKKESLVDTSLSAIIKF